MSRLYKGLKPSLDSIMYLNSVFLKDPNPKKLNLIIGSYRTPAGKPYVFKSVEKALEIINGKPKNMEYIPITGDQEYLDASKKLYLEKESKFDNVQSLSGTGALRLAGDLIAKTLIPNTIYLPNPTWENHGKVFSSAGLSIGSYDYINKHGDFSFFDLENSIKTSIPSNNIILLHACAHNPTGYDLKSDEWARIVEICMEKNLFIVIDMAYLGFASGDLEKDLTLLKILDKVDYPALVCTSYAKNFGLYSKRVGNLFFRGECSGDTINMKDTLRQIIRTSYSSPPADGSNIVKTILTNTELVNLWKSELKDINTHYTLIREALRSELENTLNKDFSNITKQTGMFYFGQKEISTNVVHKMRENGIYFLDNARISLAGLNSDNIPQFAKKFRDATTN
jgi:aspartate/tyrosine/aromatic aminotransferase